MAEINQNFLNLQGNYLFSEIDKRVSAFVKANPSAPLIRLGIGDVTLPVCDAVTKAMHLAVDEMGSAETFRGYGPYPGYEFLREAIIKNDYESRGVALDIDEVFVSDGAKSDTGNMGDIFSENNIAAICDPVYPVYLDANVMGGRSGKYTENKGYEKILYMPCLEEHHFLPEIPKEKADLIYLCFPNNPTGTTATRDYLKQWVDYANNAGGVILYDSAYEAYITDPDLPRSIYEIPGAKTCAIEFRSFSKTAGFTGTRCAYTVVPKALKIGGISLNDLWYRRQSTKFNGVPYVVQKGAEAVFSPEGKAQVKAAVDYYMANAKTIREGFLSAGLTVFGGENAPYIWFKAPAGLDSWTFFDKLLQDAYVVTTPGAGFGLCGDGYIRVTAFGNRENTAEAVRRILALV